MKARIAPALGATPRLPLRLIFIGGPGRSGTSFTAARLGRVPGVATFVDIELKLFSEKNGLLDLWLSLGPHYSPNRAVTAIAQFQAMTEALITGRYGQLALTTVAPADDWRVLFETFTDALFEHGHPAPAAPERFRHAVRALVAGIQSISIACAPCPPTHFVEKTPHALLAGGFLRWLFPEAARIHVMRDPRSIAYSLRSQSWGPDDLGTCAAWVASYCCAWHDLPPTDRAPTLFIEDAARDPASADALIARRTGLTSDTSIFEGADAPTLNGWAERASARDRALLDTRLAEWITSFGYDPDRVGRRRISQVKALASS